MEEETEKVEPFDFSDTLGLSMQTLTAIASFPHKNPTFRYKITLFLVTGSLVGCIISSCVMISMDITNAKLMAFVLPVMCCHITGLVKYSVLKIQQSKFFGIMDVMDSPVFNGHGHLNVHITNTLQPLLRFRSFYYSVTYATAVAMSLHPVVHMSERLAPLPSPVNTKILPVPVYLMLVMFEVMMLFLAASIYVGTDSFLAMLMGVASAQLKILRQNLIHSTDYKGEAEGLPLPPNYSEMVNRRLLKCVNHHIAIERYVVDLEDLFRVSFLVQIFASLLSTIFIGFNCVTLAPKSLLFIESILFLGAIVLSFTAHCVPGNEIILQSERLNTACYMSNWINCDSSVRKTLFILMERSKRPLILMAGKIVILSLNTLLNVFKSAFSYIIVLRRLNSS